MFSCQTCEKFKGGRKSFNCTLCRYGDRENPFQCKTRAFDHVNVVNTCTWELTTLEISLSVKTIDFACVMLLKVLICQWYVSGMKRKVVHFLKSWSERAFSPVSKKKYSRRTDSSALMVQDRWCQRGVWSSYYFLLFLSNIGWAAWACLADYKRTQRCGKNRDHFTQSQFLVRISGTFFCSHAKCDWNILRSISPWPVISEVLYFKNSCCNISRGRSPGATTKGLDLVGFN